LALLLGEPLEMLDDLRHLDAEGHCEVLRRVELLPVSLRDEGTDGTPQIFQTEILPAVAEDLSMIVDRVNISAR
jgi:hypothetical protein